MKRQLVKLTSCALAAVMVLCIADIQYADAAKAPKLDKKRVSVKVGKTATIKVKNGHKAARVTWKTSKASVARIVKKSTKGNKASAVISGIKVGSAKITATFKLKGAVKKMTCNVKVSEDTAKDIEVKVTPAAAAVAATTAPESAAPASPVPATTAPTLAPTQIPEPTAEPTPEPVPTARVLTANDTKLVDTPAGFKDKKADVEYGTIEPIEYFSDITNSKRTANVALPPNYDESKQYPVVYVMHGIGCSKEMFGTNIDGSSIARMIANGISEGRCEEMIAVFPGIRVADGPESDMHSNENYQNYDNFREDLINNLMPAMAEEYSVKQGRENTAVCGWSMGGREALYIGLSKPEYFGYVAGFCPAFGILPYTNPDVGKSEPGLLFIEGSDGEVITLPDEYINNTYVQISAGTYDDVVHDEPLRYKKALTSGGVPNLYNEYPSGHSEGVWEPGFYNLMLNAFRVIE